MKVNKPDDLLRQLRHSQILKTGGTTNVYDRLSVILDSKHVPT